MVADLLEAHQSREHESSAADALGTRRGVDQFLDDRLVQGGLFTRERAVLGHFDLCRKIVDDALVALEPPQHERRGDPLEPLRARSILLTLNRYREPVAELRAACRAIRD